MTPKPDLHTLRIVVSAWHGCLLGYCTEGDWYQWDPYDPDQLIRPPLLDAFQAHKASLG